jgi:hypothetical protein
MDFDARWRFGNLLVVDSTTKMTAQNLWNSIVKFGSKVKTC